MRRASTTRPTCCVVRTDCARRLLALHAAARRRRRQRRAAGRLRPAARRRSTSRSRSSARRDFDCAPALRLPARGPPSAPAIDYLAKDYQRFRRLMLDRLSLLAPELDGAQRAPTSASRSSSCSPTSPTSSRTGRTRSPPRRTSHTARRRTSLRRHARLVDYVVHEGCNARAWVRVLVDVDGVVPAAAATPLLTRVPDAAGRGSRPAARRSSRARGAAPSCSRRSRRCADELLYASHERFDFWTWGDAGCCLPRGATVGDARSATTRSCRPATCSCSRRSQGRVTGAPTTPTRRSALAVRLDARQSRRATRPAASSTTRRRTTPSTSPRSRWDDADALPFPLCISRRGRRRARRREAWGNIVLADHGRTRPGRAARRGAAPVLPTVERDGCDPCDTRSRAGPDPLPADARRTRRVTQTRGRRPREVRARCRRPPGDSTSELASRTVARRVPGRCSRASRHPRRTSPSSAAATASWSVSDGDTVALPQLGRRDAARCSRRPVLAAERSRRIRARPCRPIALAARCSDRHEPWTPQLDLLGSDGDAARVRRRGRARRRRRCCASATASTAAGPSTGTAFDGDLPRRQRRRRQRRRAARSPTSSRRDGVVLGVTNPLPAGGGIDPEPADAIRRDAPEAYLAVQERAVTAADYARGRSERDPHVQRPPATFRWTGSWHTVFVTADRAGGLRRSTTAFETDLRAPPRAATAWPATTSRSTGRASCRSSRAARLRRAGLLPRAREGRGARRPLERRCARRHARASSTPTASRSASRSTSRRSSPRRRRSPGVESVDRRGCSSASATTDDERARRPACCRWAGSRSRGSTTTGASPSAACSRSRAGGGK